MCDLHHDVAYDEWMSMLPRIKSVLNVRHVARNYGVAINPHDVLTMIKALNNACCYTGARYIVITLLINGHKLHYEHVQIAFYQSIRMTSRNMFIEYIDLIHIGRSARVRNKMRRDIQDPEIIEHARKFHHLRRLLGLQPLTVGMRQCAGFADCVIIFA